MEGMRDMTVEERRDMLLEMLSDLSYDQGGK